MSEFSIEEKANRYDEAIEKLHEIITMDNKPVNPKEIGEYLFPELKESEDERIRKLIIKHFKEIANKNEQSWKNLDIPYIIAWLEKQNELSIKWNKNTEGNKPAVNHSILMKTTHDIAEGEWRGENWCQYRWSTNHIKDSDVLAWMELSDLDKSFDKIKPKFKIGDWIITPKNKVLQITNIEDTSYVFNNESRYWEIYYCNKQCRLWTIEDAKDGDILWHSDSASNSIFIFKEIRNDGKVLCYCDYDSEDHFCLGEHHTCCWTSSKYVKPTTKEQRDLLFTKIKEAGYEWDADKKELKKIEQKSVKETSCDRCKKAQPSHSCQDITELGRCYLAPKSASQAIKEIIVDNANKVELKFHEGDFIKHNKSDIVYKVFSIYNNSYFLKNIETDEIAGEFERFNLEQNFHLWTIKDAKAGDVLANDHNILILKESVYDWYTNGTPYSVKAYCGIKPNGNFEISIDNWSFCGTLHIYPATKEQRYLLSKKMQEEGYKWDIDKKKLIKL